MWRRLKSAFRFLQWILIFICRRHKDVNKRRIAVLDGKTSTTSSFSESQDSESNDDGDKDEDPQEDLIPTPSTNDASIISDTNLPTDSPVAPSNPSPPTGCPQSELLSQPTTQAKWLPSDAPTSVGSVAAHSPSHTETATPTTNLLHECYGGHKGENSAADLHAWTLLMEKSLIHPDAPVKNYFDTFIGVVVIYSVSGNAINL